MCCRSSTWAATRTAIAAPPASAACHQAAPLAAAARHLQMASMPPRHAMARGDAGYSGLDGKSPSAAWPSSQNFAGGGPSVALHAGGTGSEDLPHVWHNSSSSLPGEPLQRAGLQAAKTNKQQGVHPHRVDCCLAEPGCRSRSPDTIRISALNCSDRVNSVDVLD